MLYLSARLETVNPATGEVIATFPVSAARGGRRRGGPARRPAGGPGWAGGAAVPPAGLEVPPGPVHGRLAKLVHAETGKPLDDAKLEIVLAILHIDWAARNARRVLGPRRVRSGLTALNQPPRSSTRRSA